MDDQPLPQFNSSPCQYHRGRSLVVQNLSLSHDGGRVLFQQQSSSSSSSDNDGAVALKHGSVTALVGVNGAGKTSFARLLASGKLDRFPSTLVVEYLAASDDEEYLAGTHGDDRETTLAQRPVEYVRGRVRDRSERVRAEIDRLEERLADGEVEGNSQRLEETADRLADLYQIQEDLGERVERELERALTELGLRRYGSVPLSDLSSGWRYKCRLVAAFLTHPDLLIVDEPSFLDEASTEWLTERMIGAAKKDNAMILLISHKEALLDALADDVLYINAGNQTLTHYRCGYSAFRSTRETEVQSAERSAEGKEGKLHAAEKSLGKVQTQLRRRERNLKASTSQNSDQRFIKGKNKEAKQKADKSAASKLKQAKRQVTDLEETRRRARRERVKPLRISGMPAEGNVASLVDVGARYGDGDGDSDDWVFENVDACIGPTDRVLLCGPNGCGKSTLAKIVLGSMEPAAGRVSRTGNVIYFPQTALSQLLRFHGDETARDYLGDGLTQTQARHHLADFGLPKDMALRPISTLSAGQRVRLWLAGEHLRHPKPALIVVDEISENVDVETRDSLTGLLSDFEGAALVISHDRDFRGSFRPTKVWTLARYGMRETYPD